MSIRLIEPSIALADARSRTALYSNPRPPSTGAARDGYLFRAFDSQDDGAGATPLLNDTDGVAFYGPVHDRSRFAFMAFPHDLRDGSVIFIVNADNTVWRYTPADSYRASFIPLSRGRDSSSRVQGTGSPVHCDDAQVFPSSPGPVGTS